MQKLLFVFIAVSVWSFSSCKKQKQSPSSPTEPSKVGSTLDLIKDSVYLYFQEENLWYSQLPTYAQFNPRSFSDVDDLTALNNEVRALARYAINPATGQSYESFVPYPDYVGLNSTKNRVKYSAVVDTVSIYNNNLNGVSMNFGFTPAYNPADPTDLRVARVYPGSAADLAGIKRGYRITAINGRTNLSYDYTGTNANVNFVVNACNYSNTISMTLTRPDGSALAINNMNAIGYIANPVLKTAVYNLPNGRTVGYLVFQEFTSVAAPKLDSAFNYFASRGVTDLVVDVRYNPGGFVSVAERMDDYIAPQEKTGSLMYITYYNDKLQNDKDPLITSEYQVPANSFKPTEPGNTVYFHKRGALNVSHVFFITGNATASATELTINNLFPVIDVQLIGATTYGKPVGWLNMNFNKYQLYTPMFYTKNSAGKGEYYGGFTPGTAAYPGVLDDDDLTKDFGDPSERLLAHALNYVQTGTYAIKGPVVQSVPGKQNLSLQEKQDMALSMTPAEFPGMVMDKKIKK